MAYTTRERTGGGQQIEELDTSVAADAVRPEVVVRPPAGASGIGFLPVGAASIAVAQVAAGAAAATLVAARAGRRSVTLKNTDTTLSVYIGPATVTAANGLLLLAGESITLTWVGLVQVIAPSGAPVMAVVEEY